jgi:hypothetical protein
MSRHVIVKMPKPSSSMAWRRSPWKIENPSCGAVFQGHIGKPVWRAQALTHVVGFLYPSHGITDVAPPAMDKTALVWLFFIVAALYFGNRYQDQKVTIHCYEELENSRMYPEGFFIQEELKEQCAERGVVIQEVGIDY